MTQYPKEFGQHQPTALGKLRTAVATCPDVHSLSVVLPDAVGKKSGAYQQVESFTPTEKKSGDPLYATDGTATNTSGSKTLVSKNLRRGKGFKLLEGNVLSTHIGRGVYRLGSYSVRYSETFKVEWQIYDGLGNLGGTSEVSVSVTTEGITQFFGRGPRYDIDRMPYHTKPAQESGYFAAVNLFSSRLPYKTGVVQEYTGSEKRLFTPHAYVRTLVECFDASGDLRLVTLVGRAGETDSWDLPKHTFDSVAALLDKGALRSREEGRHYPGVVYPFNPPRVENAGSSHVDVSELTALGAGRIGCLALVHPYARREVGAYDESGIVLHMGKNRNHSLINYRESVAEFSNSKPAVFFAVTEDYGQSWRFTRLDIFDTPVAAWIGLPAESEVGFEADYRTEQPLIGKALYSLIGNNNFNEALGRFNAYDLMFSGPDRAGSWDSKCVARLSSLATLSHVVALAADIWVLAMPLLDDRPYNDTFDDYVRWRCVVLRTDTAGRTWHEIRTPFSDLASEFPSDPDRGYALKATVLRDGVAVMKYYRALRRIGDPESVKVQPRTVGFAITYDYGVTWLDVAPQGLPSLDATMVGSLLVTKVSRTKSEVAVTAWDSMTSTYAVYISKDDCRNWVRGATVAEGTFAAMDEVTSMDYADGSTTPRNFTFLHPLLNSDGKPATVNLGAPWTHDASKTPPTGGK